MLYLWLKYIHIISSTILFGTGIGTASVMLYGHWTRDISTMAAINRYVVFVDWIFTGTSGFLQPVTGLWMVFLAGYSITSFWVLGGLIGYVIAGFCWFIVVWLQIQISQLTSEAEVNGTELTRKYKIYFKLWQLLGIIAFGTLIVVFYLMTFKPNYL